ncbi:VOC family protein [Kitasatospora sp. NPDC091335]|uniref:VOC family protein n=1 Tax=Kitasatospora sp. NPDC091335 TaxID=3364085 RepID=UPI0038041472
MLTIGSLVLGVSDMPRAVAFWTAALDYVPRDGLVGAGWTVLVPAGPGHGVQLALGLSESPVQEEPRVHLDLYAGDAQEQAAEVGRLVALGAERVDWKRYPEDPDFVVLADPNTSNSHFCAYRRSPA